MSEHLNDRSNQDPWNKAKLTGQKPPLKRKEIWAIRVRLQLAERPRDLAGVVTNSRVVNVNSG
jgi:hypothetical protein